jgi:8-oxo-dGTP pyrophosphatase MutT (NUDIX family)
MNQNPPRKRMPRVQETSAGGFVLASDGSPKVVLIGRLQRRRKQLEWCVPKGHPEDGETLEQAAIREIFEETGIEAEIIELLGSIDYEFYTPDKLISKTVHHYLLRQTGGELNVANDPDQEAVDAQWFELSELNSVLAHENEKRMARGVVEWYERSL